MFNRAKDKIEKFYDEHKVIINIATGTIIVGGLTYLGYRYLPTNTKGQVKNTIKDIIPETAKIVKSVASELPYKELRENLSGIALPPRGLGNEMFVSAQTINKKLIEAGLQERLPCGEYIMTELGRAFGTNKWKVTREGHSFSNIEWDTRVLEILYSAEELLKAKEIRERWAA